jgi:Kef-type K+ transport system membrane component KefB
MADLDIMLRFMLQVLVILVSCRLLGWFGQKYLGQAQVTMEMLTGVILGPSVFGALAPSAQQALFPQFLMAGDPQSGRNPSMSILYVVAQIGLILCMFIIGMELDLNLIRTRIKAAISVSAAGIIFPFILGCLVYFCLLANRNDMIGVGIPPAVAATYVGAAMSITAFPVLARLISEAGVMGTAVGTLAIGSGAVGDVVAWILLAFVLAASKGNPLIAVWAIVGGIAFVLVMLTVVKRMLAKLVDGVSETNELTQSTFSSLLVLLFICAWFTDSIGLHAVFGAFIVGCAMPKGAAAKQILARIEPLTVSLFIPFFFVFSGLNTRIGSLTSSEHWVIAGAILIAAVFGKVAGCYFAARAFGEQHRQSLAIGVLMNTRGLMELIILNIGLQQKIISVPFFTIMVIMALVTTFMSAPLFRKIHGKGFDSDLVAS